MTLDQVPTEARQAPEQARSRPLCERHARLDVLTQPADMLPEGLEDREAYLAQAQALNVYHQGLAHCKKRCSIAQRSNKQLRGSLPIRPPSRPPSQPLTSASVPACTEPSLPRMPSRPLSAGWARWCEAHAQARSVLRNSCSMREQTGVWSARARRSRWIGRVHRSCS